jgi:segregation and condensation protein A
MADFIVSVEAFEGPMELLCRLIEKDKINIHDIPIHSLTEQYIQAVEELIADMESLSEFIAMAAFLLEIKSRMLLPKQEFLEDETDPREELARRIEEYRRFKEAAEHFRVKEEESRPLIFRSISEEIIKITNPAERAAEALEGVTLPMLHAAFYEALRFAEAKVDKVRAGFGRVVKERFSVSEKIAKILGVLKDRRRITFGTLVKGEGRGELIVTFLALLEIIKAGRADVRQDAMFGEIFIIKAK